MNIAVIFAGGVGKRMHTKEKPKQFLEIYNKPIIVHTLEKFEKHKDIDGIIIVCVENWISYMNDLVYKYRLEKVKKLFRAGKQDNFLFIMDYVLRKKLVVMKNL